MASPLLALLYEDEGGKCTVFHSLLSPGMNPSSLLGKGPACPLQPEEHMWVVCLAAAACSF